MRLVCDLLVAAAEALDVGRGVHAGGRNAKDQDAREPTDHLDSVARSGLFCKPWA